MNKQQDKQHCDEPLCAKCLSGNCNDNNCLIHTMQAKVNFWRNKGIDISEPANIETKQMGKFLVTKIDTNIKQTEEQRKIFGAGKTLTRLITPKQAEFDRKVVEFDALPNVQVICDVMKQYILSEIEDAEAIKRILTEFNLDKDFIEELYPIAKKNVLDKKMVGLI